MSSEKGESDEVADSHPPQQPLRGVQQSRLRQVLSSPHFQSAVQLTLGIFVICLFIFIHDLKYYYNTCLAVTMLIVTSIMLAQDSHVGSKFMASTFLIGSALMGITVAGVMLTISKTILVYNGPKPPHPMLPGPKGRPIPQPLGKVNFASFGRDEDANGPYIALTCVLAVVGLGIVSINRVADNPPFLFVLGMVSCLVTGIGFIDGLYVPTAAILWNVNLRYLLATVVVPAVIALVVGILVLPTYASSEARSKLCQALTAVGNSIERSVTTLTQASSSTEKLRANESQQVQDDLVDPELDISDDAFLAILQDWTKPAPHPPKKSASKKQLASMGTQGPAPPQGPPPIASLRPLLARARMCAVTSQAEPLFLQPMPLNFGPFMGLVANAEALLTKASALESLLEDPDVNIAALTTVGGEGHNATLIFKDIMAKVAAQCSVLAQALQNPKAPPPGPIIRSDEWAAASKQVGDAITWQLKSFWTAVRAREVQRMARMKDVRSLMLLVSISSSILETLTILERLSMAVISFPAAHAKPPTAPKGDVEAGATKPAGGPPAQDKVPGGPPAKGPGPAGPTIPPRVNYWLGWLVFLLPLLATLPALHHIGEVLVKKVPAALKSRQNFVAAMKNNYFRAWLKYWLGLSTVLVLVIVIGYEFPLEARTPPPLFGYVAATLALSEKVEATVSKIVVWIGSTVIGATLGFVVMLRPNLAGNPYGLMVLICVYTFIVGIASATQLRIAITLTLMTFTGVVACQYRGFCKEGSPCEETHLRTYASRILSVSFGAIWAACVTNLVFPWYNSCWSMQMLGAAYVSTGEALRRAYLQFFKEGHVAATKTESIHGQHVLKAPGANQADGKDHPELSDPTLQEPLQPFIQKNIEAYLTAVQVSLVKDATPWKNGLLSTPLLLLQTLAGMQAELDRLSMMQMALSRPHVTGDFNGWAYRLLLEELHPKFLDILDKLQVVIKAVAAYMSGYRHDPKTCLNIDGLCADLDAARLAARQQLIQQRQVLYRAVMNAPEDQVPYLMHVDDSVRFMSFLGSFIKCVDKIESVARTVSADCHWRFQEEWLK